jgi:hypothetical protein
VQSYRENGRVKKRYYPPGEEPEAAAARERRARVRKNDLRMETRFAKEQCLAVDCFFARYSERVDALTKKSAQQ